MIVWLLRSFGQGEGDVGIAALGLHLAAAAGDDDELAAVGGVDGGSGVSTGRKSRLPEFATGRFVEGANVFVLAAMKMSPPAVTTGPP